MAQYVQKAVDKTADARSGERGNALFLILIAVALFAALSYAVTQSSRSGGDASKETNLIKASQVTQYPAAVRTAVTRMVITGTTESQLNFVSTDSSENGVFANLGGGALFQDPPPGTQATSAGAWIFTNDYFVAGLGVDTSSEVLAILPNVDPGVCRSINDSVGIGNTIPVAAVDPTGASTYAGGGLTDPGTDITAGTAALDGEPFACYGEAASGPYHYYHALVER